MFTLNILIFIIVVIVGGIFIIYTYYDNIFTSVPNNKLGFFQRFKLNLFRISSTGIVSVFVNKSSTEVAVSDAELDALLQVVYREIGNSRVISISLLESLGLYTQTVVSYLEALGYIIQ